MRQLILCHERLQRLLKIIDREDGCISLRKLMRHYGIFEWEAEQAEELGWITIEIRKPRTGRPSTIAKKLSKSVAAKLPLPRCYIGKEISIRHWRFALESVGIMPGGTFGFRPATAAYAYRRVYGSARSRGGVYASASRLMKRTDVRLMRRWFYLQINGYGRGEDMPNTVSALAVRVAELAAQQRRDLEG